MGRLYELVAALTVWVSMVPPAGAQARQSERYFAGCAYATGASATVVLPETSTFTIDGRPLDAGGEIAVMTPDGLCAGATVWTGSSTTLEVWGDDEQTAEIDGMREGDSLRYSVWDGVREYTGEAVKATYESRSPPYSSDGIYGEGKLFVLADLWASAVPTSREREPELPDQVRRFGHYPNPFHSETTIFFEVTRGTHVTLTVYNLQGKAVATLLSGRVAMGRHAVQWRAHDVPGGLYLCRLEAAGAAIRTRGLVVVK